MDKRKQKRIYLKNCRSYDFPDKLIAFRTWIDEMLAEIPAEYQHTADIDFTSGDLSCEVDVTYLVPETDKEMAQRLLEEDNKAKEMEARDLATFKALQQRFGGTAATK